MKHRLAVLVVIYGCLSSVAALLWLIAALASVDIHGTDPRYIEALFIAHSCVLVLTFHRSPGTVMWPAVVRTTPVRMTGAKTVLLLVSSNVGGWLAAIFVPALMGKQSLAEWALLPFLASCTLLSTVYVAIHWAFRPENIFPPAFLVFASNPFGAVMRKLRGSRG